MHYEWSKNRCKQYFIAPNLNGSLCQYQRTFLKTSRVHLMLPKHSSKMGCCACIMIIGIIRCIPIGHRYQCKNETVKSISLKASLTLWPSSQTMNALANPNAPLRISSNKDVKFPSWICNVIKAHAALLFIHLFNSNQILEWLAMPQKSPKDSTWKRTWTLAGKLLRNSAALLNGRRTIWIWNAL